MKRIKVDGDDKHRKRRRNSADPIPLDVIIEILKRLPAKSLMKFNCLSKEYSSIIKSRDFVDSFFSYSSNKPRLLFSFAAADDLVLYSATTRGEPSRRITSTIARHVTVPGNSFCYKTPPIRGLICYSIGSDHVICNPTTRQLLHLPRNETCNEKKFDEYLFFGYEPISGRFKVITILILTGSLKHQFWIFTVGDGNSWRKIQDRPYHYRPVLDTSLGKCINGVLYYKVHTKSPNHDRQVVSFDLKSEKFRIIKFPDDALEITDLIDYRGKLAFIDRIEEIRIWVLENAEKHEWSSKVYTIPLGILGSLGDYQQLSVGGICEGEIVFVTPRVYPHFFALLFNLEKKTTRRVEIELPSNNYDYPNYFSPNLIENVVTL